MKPPFLSQSIDGLERLFEQRRVDPETLSSLLVELKVRSTDRSRRLLESVIRAQKVLVTEEDAVTASATGTDGMSNFIRGNFSTAAGMDAGERRRSGEVSMPVESLRVEPRSSANQNTAPPEEAGRPNGEQRRLAAVFETLRHKLLDLTLRNPMLNYKPQSRSRRHLQLVDEALEDSFRRLATEELTLDIVPLPEPADIPLDETSGEFTSELAYAKAADVDYQIALAALVKEARDDEFEMARLERALRDRLRKKLGLPARAARNQIDLVDHARANRINPAIDLDGNGIHTGARRQKLQSLLLAESLQTRMGAIRDIARLSEQEMGFSTLFVAFGFLEWYEKEDSDRAMFAPLLLLPVKLDVRSVSGKKVYSIKWTSEAASHNVTLKKRLEELHCVLPEFEAEAEVEHPIEAYFAGVRAAIQGLPRWRIRSFLTLGHFAFGRLAMFQDLDPRQWASDPALHELVAGILRGAEMVGGGEGETTSNVPDDYVIDGHEVARLAPLLVHDADASQHSAIVDVMKHENLVIEGPPGTGKSQTITNIIANALARDATTSVLFLSEKRAALEVVRRRLDAAELGVFCLELHSEKSSPQQVMASLRERLESQPPARPANAMAETAWKAAREDLAAYLDELHAPDEDGESAFALFWRSVAGETPNADVPREVRRAELPERLLANPKEQLRLVAELEPFGKMLAEFAELFGPRRLSPWAQLPLSARLGEHEDVVEDLKALYAAVRNAQPVAETARRVALNYFDEEGLRAVGKIPAPPVLTDVETLARLEPGDIDKALSLLGVLHTLEAELATDPLISVGAEALEAATRLSSRLESSKLKFTPADIRQRAEISSGEADEILGRLEATRELRARLGVDDRAPFGLLPAICTAAIEAAAVPPELRSWFCWTPTGDEAAFAKAYERWSALKSAENEWAARLGGYVATAWPDPAALREASATLSEKGIGLKLWKRAELRAARDLAARLGIDPQQPATLDELAAHLEAMSRFEGDPEVAEAIGPLYRGLETEFRAMDYGLKMRAYVAGELGAMSQGARVAELLLCLGENDVTALVAEMDVALANRVSSPEVDERFGGRSFAEVARLLRKQRNESLALLANEDLGKLLDVAAPLSAIVARARRVSERDRLAAEAATFEAAITLQSMIRPPNDAEAIAAVAGWVRSVRALDLPHGAIELLLRSDGAMIRGAMQAAAQRALEALKDESGANEVLTRRYGANFLGQPHETLAAILSAALDRSAEFKDFLALEETGRALCDAGLKGFLAAIEATNLSPLRYHEVLAHVLVRRRAERMHHTRRRLSDNSGATLNGRRSVFADQDKRKIAHDRATAYKTVSSRPVPSGSRGGPQKHWTEMALINAEKIKEKRFLKVRSLLNQAGGAIRALKPCFMMSPMSVAKFLPRDMVFDIVVIDEASQMRPEDALGALLRAKQIVVVGDSKQLPPTDFFDRAMDSDDLDGDEEKDDLADESILESCAKSFNKVRSLKWHYRSRCESLIAFSNEQFYRKSLVTFPGAAPGSFSVDLVHVDGTYQASQNPAEAQRIVEEAIGLIERLMAGEDEFGTVGIVAVNSKQSELIRGEFERLSAGNLKVEAYLERCEEIGEPFFVKNLENVQGDERDFIMISLTYGREPGKKAMHQRFGPINRSQGHRRLNVLFTRARRRIGLFTSMSSADVQATETSKFGVRVLKDYLLSPSGAPPRKGRRPAGDSTAISNTRSPSA